MVQSSPDGRRPMKGADPIKPMNQPADNTHYVRRVVLPSGRAIEVVYFDAQAAPADAAPAPRARTRDLHVCPECDRELVYPVEWEEAGPTHWEVTLRCPNCEWTDIGVFDQERRRALRRGARPRHRGARRRPQAPHAGQHGGRDRALRRRARLGRDLPEDF